MAHVQRKCDDCRRSVPAGARACTSCGSRDATWVARYRDPSHAERSLSFRRKVDAERFLRDQETRKDRGEWVDPALGRTPFGEWARKVEAAKVGRRASTAARDECIMRVHVLPRFGEEPLAAIDTAQVRAFVAELAAKGYAPDTIRKAYELLAGALDLAVSDGLITRSPSRKVKLPRLEKAEMRFLSAEEITMVADAIAPRYRALVLTAAYSGLRFGELAALRTGRIDFLRRALRVEETLNEVRGHLVLGPPKTDASRRTVSLPAFLVEVLAEHLKAFRGKDDLVFTSTKGTPLRRNGFRRRAWIPALIASGLPHPFPGGNGQASCPCGLEKDSEIHEQPVRFHDLRHSHAALLIAQDVHPKVLQERLGHASIRTTLDVYGHLFKGLDEAAAEGLDAAYSQAHAGPPRDHRGTAVVHLPAAEAKSGLLPGGLPGGR